MGSMMLICPTNQGYMFIAQVAGDFFVSCTVWIAICCSPGNLADGTPEIDGWIMCFSYWNSTFLGDSPLVFGVVDS